MLVHADDVTGSVTIDGEPIATTPEHPFYVEGRGFVPASKLRAGDRVVRRQGGDGVVESVSSTGGPAIMYNLTVAVDHTFFVGDAGWWVHNDCGALPGRSGAFRLAKRELGVVRSTQSTDVLRGYYDKAGNYRSDGRIYFFGDAGEITEHFGESGQLPHFHPLGPGGDPHIYYDPGT